MPELWECDSCRNITALVDVDRNEWLLFNLWQDDEHTEEGRIDYFLICPRCIVTWDTHKPGRGDREMAYAHIVNSIRDAIKQPNKGDDLSAPSKS